MPWARDSRQRWEPGALHETPEKLSRGKCGRKTAAARPLVRRLGSAMTERGRAGRPALPGALPGRWAAPDAPEQAPRRLVHGRSVAANAGSKDALHRRRGIKRIPRARPWRGP
ncbi:hypothetical protein NDU88_006869 [Pleurodeles waltl]|uniref:Uncharacterized protein n=1 Tax=Pleurodeles waltl TaxID=8319 RepID=A0AAV7PJZ8_PLEWA|nr:hypothetical protein NDU88_006869 [Pleurodeles waltl]